MKRALFVAAALAACNTLPPVVFPPPFGPIHPGPTHLFFPTGMAVTPDGALLVANGNFNRQYDYGTVVGLRAEYVAGFFNGGHLSDQLCTGNPPECSLAGDETAVLIGNYAGPLVLNDSGTIAYTGSRDTGVLNAVAVGTDGAVSCAPGAGTGTDCRNGLVNLETAIVPGTGNTANIDGPYSIVHGNYIPQGQTTPHETLFVSSVIPHIDSILSGIIAQSSNVVALDAADPTQVLFTMTVSPTTAPSNGWAPGPMVFDSARRRLYLAGCYSRYAATGAGEPGTAKCSGNASNLLRIQDVDSQAAGSTQLYEMYSDVLSNETTQLLLADPDPVTHASTTLYATMRNPNALVQLKLPTDYSTPPRVQNVIPMQISPSDMIRIPRPGASDLIAVVAEKSNAVAIFDAGLQLVVAVVNGLGDSPFTITQVTCPAAASGSACLATSVFGECRVAFIEVPLAQPSNAVLRGRAGGCL